MSISERERVTAAHRQGPAPRTAQRRRTGAAAPVAPPLLTCRGLDVYYGAVQILFGVDFDVERGEIVALLGTNGAGKSTLLRAISGLTPPRRGTVVYGGKDVTGASPVEMARAGVAFMPGGRGIFPGLTVAENLRMAGWLFKEDRQRLDHAISESLELFPMLAERLDAKAALLSGGQQQMLTLAQAFMARPEILMIDELSLGLAPVVVGELFDVVRQISAMGTTIIVVEQSVNVSLELAERAVFMEKGEVRFTGPTADLLGRDDLLRSVFIGGGSESASRSRGRRVSRSEGPVVLGARGVTKRFGGLTAVDAVDLDVHEGEIVGIIGANGAGKTTLLDLLTGFVPVDSGIVTLSGTDVTTASPHRRAAAGMARSFQDARLFPGLTVFENLCVARELFTPSRDPLAAALRLPASLLSEALVAERVEQIVEVLGLAAFRDKFVSDLSTGSRRIVELASLLAQEPDVLMLDEPSAGIAQKESEALGPLLRRIRDVLGTTILIVEHDVPLLTGLCDRLVALELGGVIADGRPEDVIADPRVVASYLGGDPIAVNRSGAAGDRAERRPAARRRAKASRAREAPGA